MKKTIKYVKKGWGHENWIANSPKYCGKLLFINSGKKTSWHYHKLKDEVMYLQSGKVKIYFHESDYFESADYVILEPGEAFHIPIGLRHRILALEQSEIFEFSTEHFDSDSIRIIKGD